MTDVTKILQIVQLLNDLATLGLHASPLFGQASALLVKAHAEGRGVSDEELDTVVTKDDLARIRQEAAIARA